ncbi:Protein of unknown function [Gryllus bimaculatus]|nr:Protein of unknown function [Gryllus bimaculatus]
MDENRRFLGLAGNAKCRIWRCHISCAPTTRLAGEWLEQRLRTSFGGASLRLQVTRVVSAVRSTGAPAAAVAALLDV